MALIKDGRIAVDPWRHVDDDEPLPAGVSIIVSLERWRRARAQLTGRNAPLGVRLKSDQPPATIGGDLDRFGVVALEFPAATDGRAFSYARLLRDRFGFEGEIRATGAVLRDQLFFMRRCGFDAFEIDDHRDPDGALAALGEFSVVYQPAADGHVPAHRLRANGKGLVR